jgi:V/A-type H+-transporting ATPase subunit G/H
MGKEETLLKLKEAESQIRALKEAAERDREQALRTARKEALELREKMREQAETRYREIVKAAESALGAEREKIMAAGRAEAAKIAAMGRANVDRAVDHVLQKFKGALHV